MLPTKMQAVYLTGHGGYEKLVLKENAPLPKPARDEVLIRVGAAGINNTDINTRIGWYSKSITEGTNNEDVDAVVSKDPKDDGGWSGTLNFPRIQGADVCGQIVAVGEDIAKSRIGERVLLEPCILKDDAEMEYIGSERDGGFAQFVSAPASHSHTINSEWSDEQLASIPCAYSTAENLLTKSSVSHGERVLVTGASGGVGSAAVQLAKRRGAFVVAITSASKIDEVKNLGADQVVNRDHNLIKEVGENTVDTVVDLVGGTEWPSLLDILKPGGRYAVSGAIAGPIVDLDLRTLYLKDLSFFGCTRLEDGVFKNLVAYIERNEIRPLVAKTYPLDKIVEAQQDFLAKKHTGKLVLVPPR